MIRVRLILYLVDEYLVFSVVFLKEFELIERISICRAKVTDSEFESSDKFFKYFIPPTFQSLNHE